MKGFAALAVFVAPCVCVGQPDVATGSTLVNDPTHIQHINDAIKEEANSVEGILWVAGPSEFFDGMTFDDAKMVLGAQLSHIDKHLNETVGEEHFFIADADVPTDFDSRVRWKGLIHPIRDQLRCGSCWAFAATEVLSDRFAIAKNAPGPELSAQDPISCDKKNHGCDGGYVGGVWSYLVNTGTVTDKCWPYSSGGGEVPTCTAECKDREPFTKYKAQRSYAIKGPKHMAKEIFQNGPINVAFLCYRSFQNYKSGIYHKLDGETKPGGHAVKMIGYGVDHGTRYWTVANSWGTRWGEEGFFRIKRGNDECGIESQGPPYAGMPETGELIVV